MRYWFFGIFVLILINITNAQTGTNNLKLPRVAEVEEKLINDASSFLQRRFPNAPFIVSIEVDPLRRISGIGAREKNLPYYEFQEEEIVDEWDDQNISIYNLIPRIKKAKVKIIISNSENIKEVEDTERELLTYIKLVPVRDEMEVVQKAWQTGPQKNIFDKIPGELILAASIIFSALFFTLFFRRSIKTIGSNPTSAVADSMRSPLIDMASSASSVVGQKTTNFGVTSGDIHLRDPIKLKEIANIKIQDLIKDKNFPTLNDMILFSKMSEVAPKSLGALFYEFPIEYQRKIFSLGRDNTWYTVFSEPSGLDDDCIQLLDRLLRIRENITPGIWGSLLIQVWRLDEKAHEFLKQFKQEEVFAVLYDMPKSFSIPLARKIYPGAWGVLLTQDKKNFTITDEKSKEIFRLSMREKARFDITSLTQYQKDKDLIEYIRHAKLEVERDIYLTLPGDSFLTQIRPPFYKIFDGDEHLLKKMIDLYSIKDWAIVLFNTSRELRSKVTDRLDAKKAYLLSHHLRNLDNSKIDISIQVALRDNMAATYKGIIDSINLKQKLAEKDSEYSLVNGIDPAIATNIKDGADDKKAA